MGSPTTAMTIEKRFQTGFIDDKKNKLLPEDGSSLHHW